MGTLPILLNNQEILLIGGGDVALQKARVLLKNDISFTLIAAEINPEIIQLGITTGQRRFSPKDLEKATIVVDATGNTEVANLILAEKKHHFFLYNCVDQPELCDFYFSSLLNYGHLKIAVSTDGCSPALGQTVRDKIATVIPDRIETLLEKTGHDRNRGIITPQNTRDHCRTMLSTVYLIGCGPGDIDLLTLKAYRTLQQVDVVLYDHLVTQEILDLVPQSAKRISVGKQKGAHSFPQAQINEMIYQESKSGLKVARLKSGDPYIFGRGAEEAEYLIKRGIRVEVINGISSAIAGPGCAGIPPTARGYATNMSIVSAHLAGNKINTDWLPLLKIPNHTTVVLMGLSFAREISENALAGGVTKTTPVAIISNASRPEQKTVITDLEHLPKDALKAEKPALLVIGNVVNLHQVLQNE